MSDTPSRPRGFQSIHPDGKQVRDGIGEGIEVQKDTVFFNKGTVFYPARAKAPAPK